MNMMDNSLPKVSIIIPVYNGTNYLREAIESVFTQTYKNYEMIVVDDGSTDKTWEMIQSYGSHLYGIQKENGGVASALNSGIRHASGEYIAWLSHDDLFLPNKLERQVDYLKQFPQFKACYTDYDIIDENGNVIEEIKTLWFPRQEALRILFGIAYINGSTMMIERSCFEKVGLFCEHLKYTQDTEMWLRLLHHFEIGRVPEKLGKERSHPGQGSFNTKIHRAEAQDMYTQVFKEPGVAGVFPELAKSADDPKVVARVYMWLGDTMAIHRGWYAFADEQYIRAIALDPSWNNPARMKRVINYVRRLLRPGYRFIRHGLGSAFRRGNFEV
jgi:hypothetical protein